MGGGVTMHVVERCRAKCSVTFARGQYLSGLAPPCSITIPMEANSTRLCVGGEAPLSWLKFFLLLGAR